MTENEDNRPSEEDPATPAVLDSSPDGIAAAREVLNQADPEETYNSMLALSRPAPDAILQVLPYTESMEFHNPSCVVVHPEPSGLETVGLYAGAAFPAFDEVLVGAFNDPRNDHLMNNIKNLIFEGHKNVALITNHGQIIDIAMVIGALLTAMCNEDRRFGALDSTVEFDELAERINVMVSRMVTTQQAFGVPAIQVLQCGCRTFLSIPQTANKRKAKLDPRVVKANNIVTRHELEDQLGKGGQILAMAASGSQDLSLAAGLVRKARTAWLKRRGEEPPETPTLHLQPMYDGTINLMRSCEYVLPVAISLDSETPACVLGEMTVVDSTDDCHRVMDWIAHAHEEATGIPTVYHWNEDDLLTQVRSIGESRRR